MFVTEPFVVSAAASAVLIGTSWTICEAAENARRTDIHPNEEINGRVHATTTSSNAYLQHLRPDSREASWGGKPSRSRVSSRLQATSPPEDEVLGEVGLPVDMTESEARLEELARKAKVHSGGIKIFSGNGNMSLALEITRVLGISLGKATVGRFADGEVNVVIKENVRGKDVYVVQPTCPPVNDNLMELFLMVSTLRRASARRITVVIPYYGYARQDRKMQVRV